MVNVINRAAIKLTLNQEVRKECYPPLDELFKMITINIGGEAAGSFGDVVISVNDPDNDSVYKMHILPNGRRTEFTQRFFINGKWRPWYFLVPNQVVLLDGRAPIPEGFTKLGEFESVQIPIVDTSGSGSLPAKFSVAIFTGY